MGRGGRKVGEFSTINSATQRGCLTEVSAPRTRVHTRGGRTSTLTGEEEELQLKARQHARRQSQKGNAGESQPTCRKKGHSTDYQATQTEEKGVWGKKRKGTRVETSFPAGRGRTSFQHQWVGQGGKTDTRQGDGAQRLGK